MQFRICAVRRQNGGVLGRRRVRRAARIGSFARASRSSAASRIRGPGQATCQAVGWLRNCAQITCRISRLSLRERTPFRGAKGNSYLCAAPYRSGKGYLKQSSTWRRGAPPTTLEKCSPQTVNTYSLRPVTTPERFRAPRGRPCGTEQGAATAPKAGRRHATTARGRPEKSEQGCAGTCPWVRMCAIIAREVLPRHRGQERRAER
jgi:hypothetical protein